MTSVFYIKEVHKDWYNLCLKETHYCVACGTKDTLLTTLYTLMRKYKTGSKVMSVFSGCEDGGRVSDVTFTQRVKDYSEGTHIVPEEQLHSVIQKAVKDSLEDSIYFRTRRLVSRYRNK